MRSRTTVARLVIMMPLVLISITAQAKAGLITSPSVNTTAEPGGLTLYTYTLSNLDTSTLPAVEFILTVSPDANLGGIQRTEWLADHVSSGRLGDRCRVTIRCNGHSARIPGDRFLHERSAAGCHRLSDHRLRQQHDHHRHQSRSDRRPVHGRSRATLTPLARPRPGVGDGCSRRRIQNGRADRKKQRPASMNCYAHIQKCRNWSSVTWHQALEGDKGSGVLCRKPVFAQSLRYV